MSIVTLSSRIRPDHECELIAHVARTLSTRLARAEGLTSLPPRLGLAGVTPPVTDGRRAGVACKKVDFTIPPQPHGRHLSHIRRILDASGAPAAGARPNILFVIADDQSWLAPGALGTAQPRPPAFDQLAREGALLSHAFTAAPSCTPARSAVSMITSPRR